MALQKELTALKNENLAKFPEEVIQVLMQDLQKLSASGIVEKAPKVGDKIANFSLPNHLGNVLNLETLRKEGPVVITFYRGGWCPYCNLELKTYQEVLPEIKALGATLVAITPENPDESLTTSERHNLKFEVLTDDKSLYAQELGLAFSLSEELRPLYKNFGIEVEKHNGEGQFNMPLASTFVVDTDGTIAFSFVKEDYTLRAEPSEVLEVLARLKK